MRRTHKQVLLWVFLGFVAAAMLAAIVAIILPDKYVSSELMGTIVLVGLYSLAGMIIVAISRDMKWTTRIAFGAMAVSMSVFILLIWFEQSFRGQTEERVFNTATISLIVGFVFTHRLLIVPVKTPLIWGVVCKRTALIFAGFSAAIHIVGLLNYGFYGWDDAVVRLLGIALVIAAGSSIATGAIAIFGPKAGDDEPGILGESIEVELTCPRCDHAQTIRSNRDARCDHCRLKLKIVVEEPRCSCGYLLYQLESDTCPECGSAIAPDDRWFPSPT
tara:strand:- start:66862 stop:67686 length:825 start_codon:yes stop_codon:yes gene_type:complete